MKLSATKTPLLIAAIATAVTLTSIGSASANTYWASANVETAQVIDANFKFKHKKHHSFKKKSYKYHAPKHHGFKKKKHISSSHLKKKLILKKLF